MAKSIALSQLWRPLINLDNINIQAFGTESKMAPVIWFLVPVVFFDKASNADLFAAVQHQQDE